MREERVAHASVDDEHEGGCHLLCVRAHRPSVSQTPDSDQIWLRSVCARSHRVSDSRNIWELLPAGLTSCTGRIDHLRLWVIDDEDGGAAGLQRRGEQTGPESSGESDPLVHGRSCDQMRRITRAHEWFELTQQQDSIPPATDGESLHEKIRIFRLCSFCSNFI